MDIDQLFLKNLNKTTSSQFSNKWTSLKELTINMLYHSAITSQSETDQIMFYTLLLLAAIIKFFEQILLKFVIQLNCLMKSIDVAIINIE